MIHRLLGALWLCIALIPTIAIAGAIILMLPMLLLMLIGVSESLFAGLLMVIVGLGLLGAAVLAVVGYFMYWYYGWLVSSIAYRLMPFVIGLVLSVGIFTLPWSFKGGLLLAMILSAMVISLRAINYISSERQRELYNVDHYIGPFEEE